MKLLEEIGECPKCGCSLCIYKTNNYKRFIKCEICDLAYPLPKAGKLSNSALYCPESRHPILIILKNGAGQKAYFWADKPCFTCNKFDSCQEIKMLIEEFTALKVNGY